VTIDYETAFAKYNARFVEACGDKPVGAYAKYDRSMVQRLERIEFDRRLDKYVQLHGACKRMIDAGSTISDALVMELREAAAWVVVRAPDVYGMFRGELGNTQEAAPSKE
jgi:hypothetical protein